MRLLFLTQVLDTEDAVLGFVCRWVSGLAREVEALRVVALQVGDTSGLPSNVDVREIGRRGTLRRFLRYRQVLKEAFGRDGFDTVLGHMVPRYTTVSHPVAARFGAREFLWYTHGAVDRRLERAVDCVERVFTASAESMRVETPKKVVTGHGIDLEHFSAGGELPVEPPRLLSVGRLTPSKDPLTIIAALGILVSRGYDLSLDIVGGGLAPGDESYGRSVQEAIRVGSLEDRVQLVGVVPYKHIVERFRRAALVVNASFTGSVDKVVLEAMACGRPVLSCNESIFPLFDELGAEGRELCFEKGGAGELADKIALQLERTPAQRAAFGERLRGIVERDHEVDRLMRRLVKEMEAR